MKKKFISRGLQSNRHGICQLFETQRYMFMNSTFNVWLVF